MEDTNEAGAEREGGRNERSAHQMGRSMVDVCRAIGRRRAALYSEAEACEGSGLSLERLRAVEEGREGVTLGEVDALLVWLGLVVALPKRGRRPNRKPGWWIPEGDERERCPRCRRVIGSVRGCGCE